MLLYVTAVLMFFNVNVFAADAVPAVPEVEPVTEHVAYTIDEAGNMQLTEPQQEYEACVAEAFTQEVNSLLKHRNGYINKKGKKVKGDMRTNPDLLGFTLSGTLARMATLGYVRIECEEKVFKQNNRYWLGAKMVGNIGLALTSAGINYSAVFIKEKAHQYGVIDKLDAAGEYLQNYTAFTASRIKEGVTIAGEVVYAGAIIAAYAGKEAAYAGKEAATIAGEVVSAGAVVAAYAGKEAAYAGKEAAKQAAIKVFIIGAIGAISVYEMVGDALWAGTDMVMSIPSYAAKIIKPAESSVEKE